MHFELSSPKTKLPLGVCIHFWLSLLSQVRNWIPAPKDESEACKQPPRVDLISYGVGGAVGAGEVDGMADGVAESISVGAGDTVGGAEQNWELSLEPKAPPDAIGVPSTVSA